MLINTCAVFIATFAIISVSQSKPQFWKLNNMSEKELFILETKASMASGICYEEVSSTFKDASFKFQTISSCCRGYTQNRQSMGMKCDPICEENCSNGLCTAPDVCECYPGFMRVNGHCDEV